jgi:hypothetical protein
VFEWITVTRVALIAAIGLGLQRGHSIASQILALTRSNRFSWKYVPQH